MLFQCLTSKHLILQHKHDLPAPVRLQTRLDSDGGSQPLHGGSQEADGVQEQGRPGGRLRRHHPGRRLQGAPVHDASHAFTPLPDGFNLLLSHGFDLVASRRR